MDDIPFNRDQVLEFMTDLEESNLFLIKVVDQDQVQLETQEKLIATRLSLMQKDVDITAKAYQHFLDLKNNSE